MADFTQDIAFRGDFRKVDSDAQAVASKTGRAIEGAFTRVAGRLATVQTNLVRMTARLAGGVGSGLGSIASKVGGGIGSLLSVSGALGTGVTAGIGAATSALSDMIEKADGLSKLKVFDPTTYQRLAIAADKAGASTEDVEKAYLTLNKALDSTKPPEALVNALDAAGLSVERLKAMAPEEQFRTIADVVSKVSEPTEQAALAMQFFGESGVKLVPLLKDGGDAIKAIGDAAQKQGRIISQEAINASAALNDSLDAIKEPLAGLATQITTAIFPRIAEGLDNLVGFLDTHRDQILAVFTTIANAITTAVDIGSRVLTAMVPVFEAIWTQVSRVAEVVGQFFGGIEGGSSTLEVFIATLVEYLVPAIETVGDLFVWLFEHVIAPGSVIITELWTLIENIATSLGLVGESTGVVSSALSGLVEIVTGVLGSALDTLVGTLRTIISLFNTFATGTWEDAFLSLGNAILDFVLQPLRSIVSTVVTIADAISDDLVPQSIRDFASGGGIQALAREAREPQALATPQELAPTPSRETDEAAPMYGPERPPTSMGGKPKPKAGGKAGKPGKAGASGAGGAEDSLIKIAARGLMDVPMAFDPALMSQPNNPANIAPTLALALSAAPANPNGGAEHVEIHVGPIEVNITGASLGPGETQQALKNTGTQAVTDALNRAVYQLRNRRST